MNLVFIAPPAAGKGTLSNHLFEEYGIINISMGSLLRSVDRNTPLGKEIESTINKGALVDNEITRDLLFDRLSKGDIKNGFILDGFPREYGQIAMLDDICEKLHLSIDYIVHINIPYQTAKIRVLGRQTCPTCGAIYNKYTTLKPKVDDHCDKCNSLLESRTDDNEESLKARFNVFVNTTNKVIEYYKQFDNYIEIDGSGTPEETLNNFLKRVRRK